MAKIPSLISMFTGWFGAYFAGYGLFGEYLGSIVTLALIICIGAVHQDILHLKSNPRDFIARLRPDQRP